MPSNSNRRHRRRNARQSVPVAPTVAATENAIDAVSRSLRIQMDADGPRWDLISAEVRNTHFADSRFYGYSPPLTWDSISYKEELIVTDKKMTKKTKSEEAAETQELVTNEFIDQYFKSEEWVTRLHKKMDMCVYENFQFNSPPELRKSMMLSAMSDVSHSYMMNFACSSKHFDNKSYDDVFFKKCIDDFME